VSAPFDSESVVEVENLEHWQARTLPSTLVVVEVQMPGNVAQSRLDPRDVPGWDRADYADSRTAGDAWYDAAETAVLWVPSVVSPYESNALFNQRHADFGRIAVGTPRPAPVDPRLLSRQ
jgi:RES domain-containing protein